GDGTSGTVTPVGGSAAFSHVYAAGGAKAAIVTVTEGAQSWAVPYKVDLAAGQMSRDTARADILSGGAARDVLTATPSPTSSRGEAATTTLSVGPATTPSWAVSATTP
ncbi:hypothetical protein AB0L20_32115, partial [Streptomyces albidoflavus]|uniref:hypothetical protein n=1 Tax=Streptomyces albidoflavus TaxID=1886 RepID=UPI003415B3B6